MMTQSWVSCGGFDLRVTHSDRRPALFFCLLSNSFADLCVLPPFQTPPSFAPPQREVVTSLLNNVCRGPPCRGPFLTDTATGGTSQPHCNTQLTYKTCRDFRCWNTKGTLFFGLLFSAAQTTTDDSCVQSSVVHRCINKMTLSNYHVNISFWYFVGSYK